MNDDPLVYEYRIGKRKPYDYDFSNRASNTPQPCPFCDVPHLTGIYRREKDMIWLHNKYPTLRDTEQTILIESSDHQGDISTYTVESNRALMKFALSCFQKMNNSGRFHSVVWYKNFGPKADGSLRHPHMQLVGFYQQDAYRQIKPNNFTGYEVAKSGPIEMNLSEHPVQGYQEVNIITADNTHLSVWADLIQKGTQYVRAVLSHGVDSYNLFFYPLKGGEGTCCKIIPRFYAPPYFVGYKLSQVDDEETLHWEANRLHGFITNGIRFD
ncbi:MAG: DUF4931 domain-containing protein [Lactobacillus sp.]|jgi:ATP adenylyltransferase/5',5'''-P-1,P-4-tetraphosphate phosphorylase II|nr:DUF4931 domain-containing protein [Lactobacillus sp.]MCI1883705.1 DUF4931 domain-containing protein [Lactobacillus sp.]MCI1915597.1 DUF4931 domain-containing protein [Lactobacillus sp.]MCI1943139.1 DUF4931 domain-containing protein [Lactobacillus sp.]MCI1973350.1 DUF4931 domain-containing protein [Lactobacillus sp.]